LRSLAKSSLKYLADRTVQLVRIPLFLYKATRGQGLWT
jgi:hypothetical protein